MGILGMTEVELYNTSPRTFNNVLTGHFKKLERENYRDKLAVQMHEELVLAVLSPHMKKADRDRAYAELNRKASGKKAKKPKEKKLMTPEEVKAFLASQKK